MTVNSFLEEVRKDANSIFTDYESRYALETLQQICLTSESKSEIKDAKKILKQSGLSAFIPPESKKRTKVDESLKRFEKYPEELIFAVNSIKEVLSKHMKKRYKSSESKEKKTAISEAFEELADCPPTAREIKHLTQGERDKDKTAIAIGIFCILTDASSYDAMMKYYNKIRKLNKHTEVDNIQESEEDGEYHKYIFDNSLPIFNPLSAENKPKPILSTIKEIEVS